MKVYERLAQCFREEGVTALFGMLGDGNMYWVDSLERAGIRMYETRHEGAGLGMADGWARVTHDVGVATATCGPGVTQLATALVTAARASSPIVVFVGEYPTNNPEYMQYYEQSRFAEACEAGFVRLGTADATDYAVRRAFYQARTENRPVLLSCPIDIQDAAWDDTDAYKTSKTLLAPGPAQPNKVQIDAAVELIRRCSNPVVVVGQGARWGEAGDEALALAQRIGALIATTLAAKTFLGSDEYHVGVSGLYATRTAMQLFESADLVIGVGASLNDFTTEHGYLYPSAKYIQIDVKPRIVMGMQHSRAADCYVQSDAKVALKALNQILEQADVNSVGYRTPAVREKLKSNFHDPGHFTVESGRLDPREVVRVLDETIPLTVPLILGSGWANGFSALGFRRPRPFVLASQFFGCIGQGMPAALGAAAATGKPVLHVDGDASVMMHLSDFDTAVRYGWPVLTVVQNNESLGAEYYKLQLREMKAELANIATPDLGNVARALGAKGCLATRIEDLQEAAREWARDPCPMIIDARISRSVTTIPHRRTRLGEDV